MPRRQAATEAQQSLLVEEVNTAGIKVGDRITEPGGPLDGGRIVAVADTPRRARAVALPTIQLDPDNPASILALIAQAALNPKLDAGKMRELMAMRREVQEEFDRRSFSRDFIQLQAVVPVINRDGKIEVRAKDNKGQRTGEIQRSRQYSTYPNIMTICKPIMTQFGFGFSSWIEPNDDISRINVVSMLEHRQGHFRMSKFPLPLDTTGDKNNVQGWGSSQQYGMRYNAIAMLNIISHAPQDQDNDGERRKPIVQEGGASARARASENRADGEVVDETFPGPISAKEVATLTTAINQCGVSMSTFCEKYEVDNINELPASKLAQALKACADFKARNAAHGAR